MIAFRTETPFFFALNKSSAKYAEKLEASFQKNDELDVKIMSKGVFYPSDQANFAYGVGVAALLKTRRGLLYMDKIHTKKDIVFEEKNIKFLAEGAVKLAEELNK